MDWAEKQIFHAGTALQNEQLVTNGGRVISVTAYGKNLETALKNSYNTIEGVNFNKMYFRKDTEVMSNMFNIILSSLNLKQKIKTDSRLALVLSLKNPRFWDAFQIELDRSSLILNLNIAAKIIYFTLSNSINNLFRKFLSNRNSSACSILSLSIF